MYLIIIKGILKLRKKNFDFDLILLKYEILSLN